MYQGGGLERVARILAPQVALRHATQFGVHERREFFHGCLVAAAPGAQETRDFRRGGSVHGRHLLYRPLKKNFGWHYRFVAQFPLSVRRGKCDSPGYWWG